MLSPPDSSTQLSWKSTVTSLVYLLGCELIEYWCATILAELADGRFTGLIHPQAPLESDVLLASTQEACTRPVKEKQR